MPNAHFAPYGTLWLARLFGKRVVGYESGIKMTMYRWRGVLYVWRCELDTMEDD